MDEDYVIQQLSQKKLKNWGSFWSNGNVLLWQYDGKPSQRLQAAKLSYFPHNQPTEAIRMEFCLNL